MEPPRKIGKYEILERIGQGGFGLVYKARDPFIKRLVAVKICTSSDETLRKRFLREAEIAGNLHHRNIVTVFEFGYDDAGPFLIQEYLPGDDLDRKIKRREPLPLVERLRYLLQIARALEYAHKKGILHRDIKPGNVRVLEDGRIKILDFGIAKLSGAETQLTRTGRVLGTAGYLSPEQLKGDPVDSRSDVFSFGILAYELLSYEHPFPGTTISELLDKVVYSDPRPLPAVWPDCPPEIAIMIARAMDKDPERRYAGFPEIAEVLSKVLAELDPATAPARSQRSDADRTFTPTDGAAAVEGAAAVSATPPPLPPELASTAQDLEATQLVDVVPDGQVPPPDSTQGSGADPKGDPRPGRETAKEGDGLLGRTVLAAGVTLIVALAAGVIWWIAGSHQTSSADDNAPATENVAETVADVVVDAVPWGRLIEIKSADGSPLALPPETTTPLTLHLPAGAYTLTLIHPETAEAEVCTVRLEPGATESCRVVLLQIDASQYFEEAGWWQ